MKYILCSLKKKSAKHSLQKKHSI